MKCPVCGTTSKKKIRKNEKGIACVCGYLNLNEVKNENGEFKRSTA
jgi:hypothetical protein